MAEREIKKSCRDLEESRSMNAKLSEFRIIFLLYAFVVGAVIGYLLADGMWQFTHPRGLGRWIPKRDVTFALLATSCSLSVGMLGVAFVGLDLLPKGDHEKSQGDSPC